MAVAPRLALGAKGHMGLEPEAIWKVESSKDVVYGLFDFSEPIYYFK